MIQDRMTKFQTNNFTRNSLNYVENVKEPGLMHSSVITNNDVGLEPYTDMSAYNIPIECSSPNVENHAANTIRVLADMFTCRLSNFPMTVGIFTQQNNKEYLSQLASELHKLNRLENPIPLKFSKLLFIFPLVISAILGYFVGMLTNWQVGLSIGHIGMFIQITFLALIIIGSRFCQKPLAIRASYLIARFLQWIKLFLNICFCYPVKSINTKTPVRVIVVYHRICPSSTTNMALFSLVEKMWFGLVRHYGQILIRLQRAGKPSGNPNIKYKRVCCLPAFIVMIAFWIAFLISTSIIRLYSGQLTKLLGHGGLLSLFVIMSSIMFLSFVGSLPSILRIIKGLLINPITPIKTALTTFLQSNNDIDKEFFIRKSIGKLNDTLMYSSSTSFKDLAITVEEKKACKADLFIKSEFAKLCNLSITFDQFNNIQQTRFILCLDASSILQKDLLAKLIYQIHNLLLTVINAPVAIVLEANFKILLGDLVCSTILSPNNNTFCNSFTQEPKFIAQIVGDNFHLVHASLYLPIYLEPPIFTDLPEIKKSNNEHMKHNQLLHSSLNGYSSENATFQSSIISTSEISTINVSSKKVSTSPNCVSSHVPSAMFNNFHETNSNNQHSSKIIPINNEKEQNKIKVTEENEFSVNDIASMFLHNHELADWNGKVIKQLVLSTAFTYRLLKLYNMNIEIELVVLWVTLVHHWPYHTTWLIIYLEDLNASNSINSDKEQSLEMKINLMEAFLEIKKRVGESIEILEALATEDRDLERLNKFLYSKSSTQVPVNSLKQLIACSLINNPFIRYSIQALVGMINGRQSSGLHHSFFNPLDAVIEEKSDTTNQSLALDKVRQTNSVPIYASIQLNSSIGQTNQMGCKTTGSLSSAENLPPNAYWPCSSDTITTGDNLFNKPCPIRLKKRYPSLPIHQFTVNDVCELFSSIVDIHPSHMQSYISKIKQLNINGIVLSVCDLESLRQELMIEISDWQVIYKLITWLRSSSTDGHRTFSESSQQRLGGISSNEFDVSDLLTGYNMNFKGKYQQSQQRLSNHTLLTSMPSLNSEKMSCASDQKPKISNPFLVRQTPWLVSPKIPITSLSNGKSLEPFQEFTLEQRPSPDASDQQNSCSAMEEPESLWKTDDFTNVSVTKDKTPVTHPNMLVGSIENSHIISNPNLFSHQEGSSKPKEIRKTSKHLNNLEVIINKPEVKVTPGHSFHRSLQNSMHSNRFVNKNGYASRSSIDLRTVFGPEQKNPPNTNLFSNYRIIHNSKRSRVKKALIEQHRRQQLQQRHHLTHNPNFNYFADPEFCSPFVCPLSKRNANFYNHDIFNNKNHPFDPNLQNINTSNLRRITKQPRRNYDYQTIEDNTLILIANGYNNESSIINNEDHINNITPSKIHIKQCHLQESLKNVESETDDTVQSSDNKSSQLKFLNQNKSFLNHLKYYPSYKIHPKAVFSSPALTPAQLTSLQAYTEWSTKMNPYFANPTVMTNTGSVIPNNSTNVWSSYLDQHQVNKFPIFKPSTHKTSDHKSFRPSQKKRPRKTNPDENEFIINPNKEFQPTTLTKPNVYSLTLSCDSEAELCTCDYWYELEKAKEKFTISEPSLRAESDLISIDDYIIDNDYQTSATESLNSIHIVQTDKSKHLK
ncbi:unnamed protein product [Schistosoma rodhaini]|uniref:Ras-GEF domain-containing protein n=1 Tax=Schistosoma rodhaini TaxID=6188 RepID=A0AA85G8M8_9TREM|nr:unnamed protein product [Schistosoma rodhaini]CAH8610602.1 unnamed protein product [Schistosoma rodhaini]